MKLDLKDGVEPDCDVRVPCKETTEGLTQSVPCQFFILHDHILYLLISSFVQWEYIHGTMLQLSFEYLLQSVFFRADDMIINRRKMHDHINIKSEDKYNVTLLLL